MIVAQIQIHEAGKIVKEGTKTVKERLRQTRMKILNKIHVPRMEKAILGNVCIYS